MKYLKRSCAALLVALLFPAIASAAMDMFLKIENAKGEKRVVQMHDGAVMVDGLAAGKYLVTVCDAAGTTIPSDVTLSYTVITARETGSGMATGRRMHKPLAISKQMTRSAAGVPPPNEIAIDEPGVHVAIGVSTQAVDAAVAKATKTRSNIQNN